MTSWTRMGYNGSDVQQNTSGTLGSGRDPPLARNPSEGQNPSKSREPPIVRTFASLESSISGGPPIDDRLHVFQTGIEAMTTIGTDDQKRIKKTFISLLHDKRQSSTPLGQERRSGTYRYSYVRKVNHIDAGTQLPVVDDIFKTLLCGSQTKHRHGVSGLVYALANIIFLSISRTFRGHSSFNETSAYFDLSPLYGVDENEEKEVRVVDGRGMLASDCFFEDRVEFLSPAVSVLLILLNRNHNNIARRILANGWTEAVRPADSSLQSLDDKIFSIARSINCIQFKNIITEDFLKGLMGLPNVSPSPTIDLSSNFIDEDRRFLNSHKTSIEFTLLYHLPTLMSSADSEWLTHQFGDEIPPDDARNQRATARTNFDCPAYSGNPTEQPTSTTLKRGPDGRFADDDLAEILLAATESEAGMPGARHTLSILKNFSATVMAQARSWKVCTLNEFRIYLGLKPFATFEEWNSDRETAQAARELYGTIDRLELYPGLQAEATVPASGFCLGYTQTFGLLMDIVTSIRSDPRFTTELTPDILTPWGVHACAPQPNNGAFGAMLSHLILRNLARNYSFNNTYALFPLIVPSTTRKELIAQQLVSKYDCERPSKVVIHTLRERAAISHVLNSTQTFATPYGKDLKLLTKGYGYILGFDDETLHDAEQYMMLYALMPDTRSFQMYTRYFGETAKDLIEKHSREANGVKEIDVIQDVIIPSCTRWVCQTICNLSIALDDKDALDAQFRQFAALYAFIFHKFDAVDGWQAREDALAASDKLHALVEKNLDKVLREPEQPATTDYFVRLSKEFTVGHDLGTPMAHTFLERLSETNDTVGKFMHIAEHDEFKDLAATDGGSQVKPNPEAKKAELKKLRLAAHVLGLCVVLSVNYAQACSQAVHFYLGDEYTTERETIVELVKSKIPKRDLRVVEYIEELRQHPGQPFGQFPTDDPQEPDKPEIPRKLRDFLIMGYIREAQRLGQPFGLFRTAKEDSVVPPSLQVRKGEHIYADFGEMHCNSKDFPDPQVIHPGRITHSIQGMGLHKCPGLSLCDNTMPELFKVFFSLQNLRRAEGSKGMIRTFNSHDEPVDTDPRIFLDARGETTPYPRSLVLTYDRDTSTNRWVVPKLTPPPQKKIMDNIILLSALLALSYQIFLTLARMMPTPTSTPELIKTRMTNKIQCNSPTTVFQRWDINTIVPGLDGQPSPIEYTLERKKPHRLTVLDIDARDMQLALYVDGIMQGMSTEFKLDKSVQCGDSFQNCVSQNFSRGVIVVPPGRHTVKIAWAGKEFLADTRDIDWGNDYSRRLMWQLEQCS